MEDHLRQVDVNGKQINKTSSALSVGFKNVGKQIRDGMLNPANLALSAITLLIKALTSADKQAGELAKSFGVSYSQASDIRNELNSISNSFSDVNVTTATLQKSLIAINKEFGTASKLDGELLKDFTLLTEAAGYTNEAALGLSKIVFATGTDLSENTTEILGQAMDFNALNGLALNEKEIVEEVSKASSATTLSLGLQSKELAKAVIQAKALGVNLAQVEQIASSLLSFESSIQSELEAELLTGKAINLEVAREAALRGDLATVASEVANQIGTASDFTNMNVLAQEALAKSVGMTREDLAKSLIEREALARIGMEDKTALEAYNELKRQGLSDAQIENRLGNDKLTNQLKSQSIQERFAASMEKLQEIFVTLATPILEIITPFSELISMVAGLAGGAGAIIKPLMVIYGIYKAIKFVQTGMLGVQIAMNAQKMISANMGLAQIATNRTISALEKESFLTRIAGNAQLLYQLVKEQGIAGIKTYMKGLDDKSLVKKVYFGVLSAKEYIMEQGKVAFKAAQVGLETTLASLKQRSLLITLREVGASIAKAAMGVISSLSSIPVIGWALGLAAAGSVAALGYKLLKADDAVSPGYGKRTMMSPEGTIQFNDKDTIVAGTNLFPEGDTKEDTLMSSPSIPSINLEPLIQEMQGLKDGIERLITLVSEGGDVYIDGTKVGKTLQLASSRMG
jgi:hypothetical protein